MFTYLSRQNDLNAKMIELSISILRADVQEETLPLREWAIDVRPEIRNALRFYVVRVVI